MDRRITSPELPTAWAPLWAVAAGCLALSACSSEYTSPPAEQASHQREYYYSDTSDGLTPEDIPSSGTPIPDDTASTARPSKETIGRILEKACAFTEEQSSKQYPSLWGNGNTLGKYSREYHKAYHNQSDPWQFDTDLAEYCPTYARMTDHGAG